MHASKANAPTTLGFLTFAEFSQHGVVGGYLILNVNGRPIEFHCSAPVKANRAQEILYGPTLMPYLYGEQIARMLTRQTQQRPLLILTDCGPAVSVRPFTDCPVLVVLTEEATSTEVNAELANGSDDDSFLLGDYRVAVSCEFPEDQSRAVDAWKHNAAGWDLLEPFERIREAISEAQRAAA